MFIYCNCSHVNNNKTLIIKDICSHSPCYMYSISNTARLGTQLYIFDMRPRQKALTFSKKFDLIKAADAGKSFQQLADEFKIGKTQASCIIKQKAHDLPE